MKVKFSGFLKTWMEILKNIIISLGCILGCFAIIKYLMFIHPVLGFIAIILLGTAAMALILVQSE